jgi:hypothetical protein
MSFVLWIELLDEGISLLFLVALGLAFYRGYTKNHNILCEREDLLKRYLLFRGDKQVRLKVFREDEGAYQELLKTISNSWKNFKKTYDDYICSLTLNTLWTKRFLWIITLGLLLNSMRLVIADTLFLKQKYHLLYTLVRELSSYVLVLLSFALLKIQTNRFLPMEGKAAEIDREFLFFPNGSVEGEDRGLYNEFDPIDAKGAEDGEKDEHPCG